MEAGGERRDRRPVEEVVGEGSDEAADLELAVDERHGVGAGLGGVGGVFEFDGGLAFVGDFVADSQQR